MFFVGSGFSEPLFGPPWLLWFTQAEFAILFLGLKLPDLSSMARFARPRVFYDHLPLSRLNQPLLQTDRGPVRRDLMLAQGLANDIEAGRQGRITE
jgi:hypothetical protein